MSAAFDTILRSELIDTLKTFLDEDEIRLIQYLLSNTTLDIKCDSSVQTDPFDTNVGSPQGDSLSGCLFTVYFEMSLKKLRAKLDSNSILDEHSYATKPENTLPDEVIYADDCDFITDIKERKHKLISTVTESLLEDNLKVNDTKTEHTTLKRSSKDNETWRSVKKLGSLIGDKEDILQRKQLSIAAMRDLNKLWIRKNRIRRNIRLKLYRTIVKTVLTYNSSTWGLGKTDEDRLDSFHRNQLRKVLHIRYPNIIRNKDLYELTQEIPLSLSILQNRWRLFGHILRLDSDTPARKSMAHYFTPSSQKKFRGRSRQTLPTTINRDLIRAQNIRNIKDNFGINSFTDINDLNKLTIIASDKNKFDYLTEEVFKSAQAERSF
jgi:hypothetical protein